MRFQKWFNWILVFFLLVGILPVHAISAAIEEQNSNELFIQDLIQNMTPEEKVGQLFLVSFQGTDISDESQIYDLITNHHIGGIVLSAKNNNFSGRDLAVTTQDMVNGIQNTEWEDSLQSFPDLSSRLTINNYYVPLFIGISQDGNSAPYDNIINEITQLPNLMAIGATWNTENAYEIGSVMGQELSSIGFNFYFGPSLDVLDLPYVEGGDDLGVRTFGGDPYWVGEMGKAYVSGLHDGSNGEIAVIAKHFPGRGSSDRLPEEEVATVRKSLEQLKQIELAPFFSVTGFAPTEKETVDGLLMSHIRYQGFQGNIRATTKPVSFDQAAQEQLMSLEELVDWRKDGGIIVSDNLGSNAVRKFFYPGGENFDAWAISRNAFLSGNDLLFYDLYIDQHDLNPYATLIRVLESFASKYREDNAFAQRVDLSVERILKLKYKIYPNFQISDVLKESADLENFGGNKIIGSEVANQAAVLMSPDNQELSVILARPPQLNERIIFFTDQKSSLQCSDCVEQNVFSTNALENTIIRLYGPEAGEQIQRNRLASYSFRDLNDYLDDSEINPTLDSALRNANWIVFSFIKPDDELPESKAMLRMLSDRQDLLTNKKVVAFGFDAPYYLDATDISKLTAYYVLFSKTEPFIETAARILFQEQNAVGALPVSVPGIGYSLIEATAPDPEQIIPVFFEFPSNDQNGSLATPDPVFIPEFELGDTVAIRTGVIYDQNRNPVPDGTVVRFMFSFEGASATSQQVETTTYQGIARIAYRVQNVGLINIRVTSDPAMDSQILNINVPEPVGAEATIVVLQTPLPTATEVIPTPTPTEEPYIDPEIKSEDFYLKPDIVDWLLVVFTLMICSLGIFFGFRNQIPLRWVIRWALLAFNGGLLGFILIGFQLIIQVGWVENFNTPDIIATTVAGALFGWVAGWLWYASNQWKIPS